MEAFTLEYQHLAGPDLEVFETLDPWSPDHVRARYLLILTKHRPPTLRSPVVLARQRLPVGWAGDYLRVEVRPVLLVPHHRLDEAWRHLRAMGYYPDEAALRQAIRRAKTDFNQTPFVRGWRGRRKDPGANPLAGLAEAVRQGDGS